MDDVVAGLLVEEGRVLLCHRAPERRWYPNVWDLPGGHVEPGETRPDALRRELAEELGVEVTAPDAPAHFSIAAVDFTMAVWVLTVWSGSPTNCSPEEHDELGWFGASEVEQLELAHPRYRELLRHGLRRAEKER